MTTTTLAPVDQAYIEEVVRKAIANMMNSVSSRDRYEMELRERVIRVEEGLKRQSELMQAGFALMEKRFEQVDKRFEQMQQEMQKGFDQQHRGIIYVRAEYPLAIKRINRAIEQARNYGLMGKDIFGTGFDFDAFVYPGAGAFVCGESTALMFSLEGKRGMPRAKPPRSAEAGLWGQHRRTRCMARKCQQGDEFIGAIAQHQRITVRHAHMVRNGMLQIIDALAGVTVDSHSPKALTQFCLQTVGQSIGVFHGVQLDHARGVLHGVSLHVLQVLSDVRKIAHWVLKL